MPTVTVYENKKQLYEDLKEHRKNKWPSGIYTVSSIKYRQAVYAFTYKNNSFRIADKLTPCGLANTLDRFYKDRYPIEIEYKE